jgi:hypothetical protein
MSLLFSILVLSLVMAQDIALPENDDIFLQETTETGMEEDIFSTDVPESGEFEEVKLEESTGFKVDNTKTKDLDTGNTLKKTMIDTTTPTYPEIQITGTTDPSYSWQTNQGTVSQFSMTDALFNLGSLVQGSFVSFNNNNNLLFSSLFDASKFSATLDEEGEVQVAQKNGFGKTGQVYITINNGNLTQDEYVVFVPEGDSPKYIYYNTTEVEFEDGSISLLGESITNKDGTKESTTVEFNENGFTKMQLLPDNEYISYDYSIYNTNSRTLIICKQDPLCDINIDRSTFILKGKVNFTFQGETIYQALDGNNVFTINVDTGEITITNPKTRNSVIAYMFTGNHRITETTQGTFDLPIKQEFPGVIQSYTSSLNKQSFTFEDGAVSMETYKSFAPVSQKATGCLSDAYC